MTHPPSAVSSGTTAQIPPRPSPAAAAAAVSSESAPAATPAATISGAGEKPCKFGAACTRPNCVFVHPWDVRGDPSAQVNCRYGAACTRADCHFKHPAHRPAPYNRNKFSATFNKSSSSSAGATTTAAAAADKKNGAGDGGAIAPKPAESADHISERLKRFATASGPANGGGGGETERILPGQQQAKDATGTVAPKQEEGAGGARKNGNTDDEDKLEISIEEEDEKKVEVANKAA